MGWVIAALTLACSGGVSMEPTTGPDPPPSIDPLIVDHGSEAAADVVDALRLRLPDRLFVSVDDERPQAERPAWVRLRPDADGVRVELILWDGRAFYRDLRGEPDEIPREAATILANLLAGIEAGRLAPDATGVAPPEPEPEPDPEPEPPVTEESEPEPESEPPRPQVDPAQAGPPRLELGWAIAPTLLLGLGPPSAPGLAAGGATATLDLRWRSGALLSFAVRGAGRQRDSYGLGRLRVSAGGGIALRRGAFELLATASLDAEPWFVRGPDGVESLETAEGPSGRVAALVGGHARLVPAYRRSFGRRGASLRIGPRLDVAGGTTTAGGIARVRTRDQDGAPRDLFRVGALELALGFELGMWFPTL
jgi:hypothetical protein